MAKGLICERETNVNKKHTSKQKRDIQRNMVFYGQKGNKQNGGKTYAKYNNIKSMKRDKHDSIHYLVRAGYKMNLKKEICGRTSKENKRTSRYNRTGRKVETLKNAVFNTNKVTIMKRNRKHEAKV